MIWSWQCIPNAPWSAGVYVVTMRGQIFGVPRSSLWATLAYLHRCKTRYPRGLPEVECGAREKGGPWRWRHEGKTGVVHCSRKADAITTLRHQWRRQRLPNRLTWEITRG